jgi:hypothetical protein
MKHMPDNTVAVADKAKKFSKPRKFDDIENMHCIWHPNENHMTRDCRIFFIDTQERAIMEKEKKITRRRMKTIMKTRDSRSPRGRS